MAVTGEVVFSKDCVSYIKNGTVVTFKDHGRIYLQGDAVASRSPHLTDWLVYTVYSLEV